MKLDFSKLKVLLIGDFMIDHYTMGSSNKMSPEAPVPIVIPNEEYSIPGGAGNVAINLSALGAKVSCIGTIGDDNWGSELLKNFVEKNIDINAIQVLSNHPTTLKQRIYSNGTQVARLDKEKIFELKINNDVLNKSKNFDVIILSDYNKGVLADSKLIIKRLISIINCSEKEINIIVDPKKSDFNCYKNANIITPNLIELQKTTNHKISDNQSIINACNSLIEKFNFDFVCAKKGEKGITIVGKNGLIDHIKPNFVKQPDVTGAGDTTISALSLAYSLSGDIIFAAKIANAAASIAVSKTGTASVNIDELNELALKIN